MKQWLKRLIILIAGDPEEFSLEHRNLNGACFIAIVGSILACTVDSFVYFSLFYNLTVIVAGIIYATLYYISRRQKKTKYINVIFLVISLASWSVAWFLSQGIEGTTPYVFFDLLIISLITFRTEKYLIIISFYILCLLALLSTQYLNPSLITPYVNKTVQLSDLSLALIISMLIFSYLVTSLKRNYENERAKVEQQKFEIEKQNKEIQRKNIELEEKQEEINAQKESILNQKAQLEKINQELLDTDEIKSRFFANISHEFRTPLTLIIDPIQTLRDKTTDKSLKEEYNLILKHSERLLLLINQLLDISKIEKGKMQLVLQEVSFNAIIQSIATSFASFADEKRITFHLNEKDNDIQAFFDVDKLEKIFYNLLSNAFKFTPEGGQIDILVQRSDSAQNVEICVKDTGIGIIPENIPYIFDRFYQVDGGRNRAYEGTGIGLALTRELVLLHQGTIEVSSVPDNGTVFKVILPLNKTAYSGENIVFPVYKNLENQRIRDFGDIHFRPEANIPLPDGTKHEKRTVLVVEDNYDMRNHLIKSLSAEFHIDEATNGEEGIQKALNQQPDLVLSDVMMPGIDGFQMTLSLKNNPLTCHIPVILLTAKAGEEDKMEGLHLLADDYITKPFGIKEVIARINSQIRNREKLRDKFGKTLTVEPSEITTTSLDEQFIRKILDVIETNIANPVFSVDDLCREMSMSRTSVHLKLKAITNQSTTEFIRSIRLKRAAQLIRQKAGNITDIAYMTGFTTPQYFSRSFREHFNVSPSEY